jgi:hypothetical protein
MFSHGLQPPVLLVGILCSMNIKLRDYSSVLKSSDDGVLLSELLRFWTLSIVYYSKRTQRFRNFVFSCPGVKMLGGAYSVGSVRTNLNRCISLPKIHPPHILESSSVSFPYKKHAYQYSKVFKIRSCYSQMVRGKDEFNNFYKIEA